MPAASESLIYFSMDSFGPRKVIQVAGRQRSTREEINRAVIRPVRWQREHTVFTLPKVMKCSRNEREIWRLRTG